MKQRADTDLVHVSPLLSQQTSAAWCLLECLHERIQVVDGYSGLVHRTRVSLYSPTRAEAAIGLAASLTYPKTKSPARGSNRTVPYLHEGGCGKQDQGSDQRKHSLIGGKTQDRRADQQIHDRAGDDTDGYWA